jgi:hypothetical protein
VAYSSSFPATYIQLNSADWAVTATGSNVGGSWVSAGSTLCCSGPLQAIPAGALVQVLGPSFATSTYLSHVP